MQVCTREVLPGGFFFPLTHGCEHLHTRQL
jgi:hypothetical protein